MSLSGKGSVLATGRVRILLDVDTVKATKQAIEKGVSDAMGAAEKSAKEGSKKTSKALKDGAAKGAKEAGEAIEKGVSLGTEKAEVVIKKSGTNMAESFAKSGTKSANAFGVDLANGLKVAANSVGDAAERIGEEIEEGVEEGVEEANETALRGMKKVARKMADNMGDSVKRSMDAAEDRVRESMSRMGSTLKNGLMIGGAAAVGGIGVLMQQSIDAASDASELENKVNQVFGEAGRKQLEEYGKTAARTMGQSKTKMLDASTSFGIFGKEAGLAGDDLVNFSYETAKLASDLSSFHNLDTAESIETIVSALKGETSSLTKFGVVANDEILRQHAVAMGISQNVKDSIDPAQKALVVQSLLMEKSADAHGDFERTNTGLANSTRTLTEMFADLKVELGKNLLPVVESVVGWLVDEGMPKLERFGEAWNEKILPGIQGVSEILFKGDFSGKLAEAFGWEEDSKIVDVLFSIREGFVGVLGKAKAFGGWIVDNKDALIPIAVGIGAIATAVGLYQAAIGIATAVQVGFNIVMAANPWGLLALAIVGVVAALTTAYQTSDTFRNFVDKAWSSVKGFASAIGDGLGTTISWIWEKLKIFGSFVGELFTSLWGDIQYAWETWGSPIFSAIWDGIKWGVDKAAQYFDSLKLAAQLIWADIKDKWETWGRPVFDLVAAVISDVVARAKTKFIEMQDKLTATWNAMVELWYLYGQPVFDLISAAVQWVVSKAKEKFDIFSANMQFLWAKVQEYWLLYGQPAFDAIVGGAIWLRDKFVEVKDRIATGFQNLWLKAQEYWAAYGQPVIDWVVGKFIWWRDKNVEITQAIISKFQELWDGAKNLWHQHGQPMVDMVVGGFVSLKDKVVGAFRSVRDGIAGIWTDIKNAGKESVNWLIDKVINGMIRQFNKLADYFGTKNMPLVSLVGADVPATGSFNVNSGPVRAYATGGLIHGPGTGTSDSVMAALGAEPIRLSNGEFIVNAAATKKHRGLIEAINADGLRKFATGGYIAANDAANTAAETGASSAWQAMLRDPIGGLKSYLSGLWGSLKSSPFGAMLAGGGEKVLAWIREKFESIFKAAQGSSGSGGGSLRGGSFRGRPFGGGTIVDLGRWLQTFGVRVSEHPAFGGVRAKHSANGGHYHARALDLNYGPGGQNAIEMAYFDQLAPVLRSMGLKVIWRAKGHYNHIHVTTPHSSSRIPAYAFDSGGVANGIGYLPKRTIKPERVLSPRQTESFERLVDTLEKHPQDVGHRDCGCGDTTVHINVESGPNAEATADAVMRRLRRAKI